MKQYELNDILNYIESKRSVTVKDFAVGFSIPISSARSRLAMLVQSGYLRRYLVKGFFSTTHRTMPKIAHYEVKTHYPVQHTYNLDEYLQFVKAAGHITTRQFADQFSCSLKDAKDWLEKHVWENYIIRIEPEDEWHEDPYQYKFASRNPERFKIQLGFIESRLSITAEEFAKRFNISTSFAGRWLHDRVQEGLVEHIEQHDRWDMPGRPKGKYRINYGYKKCPGWELEQPDKHDRFLKKLGKLESLIKK